MPKRTALGEFEQRVLLAILRLEDEAYAVRIGALIEEDHGRTVARGALYTTLDRLESKNLIRWKVAATTAQRDGLPRRQFSVTAQGVRALESSRDTLRQQLHHLNEVLGGS